ncbi:PALB protein [Whalleya microplaca]|nr:PALB protein [Whalleya microplaca]
MEAKAKEHEVLAFRTYGKEALDHAIAAAELYMKAAKAASSYESKGRLTKKCQSLLSKAETLKKADQAEDTVTAVERRLKLPRMARQIPTAEQTLLLRNSRLHGNVFPPWESDPDPKDFSGELFEDTSEFSFSTRQTTVFAGWKRPLELMKQKPKTRSDAHDERYLMEALHDHDLVQDITTDCSVVASLCASMKHLRPGRTSILSALMFPIDSLNGQPLISDSGKYVFRMFFNGCFRKVVIDDRLPSSSNGRTLYVVDRLNPDLVWPALMEKAYLKVRGGYDFPGSNSGTDLCALTGWIPQQLFLQSDDLDWDRTWNRIKKAFDYDDVVVTIGTGRLSDDEEEILGLAGEHDYAVLDMSETPGNRRLLVKNPWCDGLVWRGIGSSDASQPADDHPSKLKPGSFWISFDDVTRNFESLYLNWNPSLFTERQDHHFTWHLPEANMIGSFAHNPQYSMVAAADGNAWILLSRHFQDGELDIMRSRTTTLAAVSNKLGFMSIYIFSNDGKRVQLSDKSIYRGDFVDSPQTLAPFEAKKGVKYTVVVATQELPLPEYSFTLSFFSRCALAITRAEDSLKHYTEIKSSWTRRTAGGNSASPTYLQNPQFSITLTKTGPLSLLISTYQDDVAVHVDLVWAGGQRVTAVGNRDLVTTSGDYRRGCALAESPSVDAGTYTVVCSTFETGQLTDFTLRVGTNSPCLIIPVPADAAGRLRNQLPILAFGTGEAKKRAALSAERLTRASVVVNRKQQAAVGPSGNATPRSHPTVRVRLECGTGPNKVVLASTGGGEFKEVALGLRTPEFDIDPRLTQSRALWLVVEQLGLNSVDDGLQIEVYSEGHVNVGAWETVDD